MVHSGIAAQMRGNAGLILRAGQERSRSKRGALGEVMSRASQLVMRILQHQGVNDVPSASVKMNGNSYVGAVRWPGNDEAPGDRA